ncbi:MAG: OmpA family protein [Epsilonproteobacteria bacterium]|nr:OmpA family protein [Campylobacterota bacterium]
MKKMVAVALALSATLLLADNSKYNFEFTPMVGGVIPEGNLDLENQLAYGGSLGINFDKDKFFDQIELGFLRSDDVDYDNSNLNTDFNRYFVNLVKDYKLNNKAALYTLIGVGYEDVRNEQFDNESSGFFNYGLGIKYNIVKNLFLKADVRHMIKFSHGDNNLLCTLGLGIPFGAVAQPEPKKEVVQPKDSDGDGVTDDLDRCPHTKPGVAVDSNGCELDSDGDGVLDSNDMCPNTPAGVTVDSKGCELDSDGDGVVDSLDKCPDTPAGVKVNKDGCPLEITLRLHFDTNKAVIKPEYDQTLRDYAEYLKKMQKVYNIEVKGYTDSRGSADYNKKLSLMRAMAVRTRLVQLGVDPDKIIANGYGEADPVASNDTEEGRYLNRRVVIELTK